MKWLPDQVGVVRVVGDEDDAEAGVAGGGGVLQHHAGLLDAERRGGSSRISTRAPKYTARAMATHWRWPPERVPIGWLMSLTTMPILRSSVVGDLPHVARS